MRDPDCTLPPSGGMIIMNDMGGVVAEQEPDSAFTFTGHWKEFLPIAVTNLLLTIVTLGVYRFWAKARERRYLWSRTRFIDDPLEWTGTGLEMFIGFLLVFVILLPALLFIQFGAQALIARGEAGLAALMMLAIYAGIFYLIGVGSFRALRYRLSRTWWHGIRGGSDDGGWSYGFKFLWKMAVGYFALALLIPWSITSLWNDRMNKMSFGQHPVEAAVNTDGLFARWMLVYLAPIVGVVISLVFAGGVAAGTQSVGASVAAGILAVIFVYVAFLLVSLSFYAAFYRQAVGSTWIAGIGFEFTARTSDWLKLILGNIALVVFTLGAGLMFIGYRNWSFFVRHMEATGEINLDTLLQSRTAAGGDAEGLADAFDIGAI